ncbi:hypothetical protein ACLOAV_004881 [Pseudogymnoascus australis]
MNGYGATIRDREDGEILVYDKMEVHEPHICIVDGDIATFRFYTQKPDLPYAVGSCLKARPHTSKPPDNDNFPGLETGPRDKHLRHEIETVDPLHRCLLHPPPRGTVEPGEVEFKVVDWVQAGDPNNSQVVAVRILNSTLDLPTDVNVLAKIYDPL